LAGPGHEEEVALETDDLIHLTIRLRFSLNQGQFCSQKYPQVDLYLKPFRTTSGKNLLLHVLRWLKTLIFL